MRFEQWVLSVESAKLCCKRLHERLAHCLPRIVPYTLCVTIVMLLVDRETNCCIFRSYEHYFLDIKTQRNLETQIEIGTELQCAVQKQSSYVDCSLH